MKVLIPATAVSSIKHLPNGGLLLEVDMTEKQMFNALNCFLEEVSDDVWAKWQAQINLEIYGETT